MSDLDNEMLLGYLMNALEDDEIAYVERELLCQPDMQTELATLQKELSPLTYVYESVDPPYNLAQRTCRRIWKHFDQTKHKNNSVSDPISEMPLGSIIAMAISASHFENGLAIVNCASNNSSAPNTSVNNRSEILEMPEKVLTVSPCQPTIPSTISTELLKPTELLKSTELPKSIELLKPTEIPKSTEHSNSKRLIRRSPHYREPSAVSPQKQIGKNHRWFDISVSIAVGILIAVIVFPVINYVQNQTQNYFTQSKIHEINKSIDHYTQLQGKVEKTTPIENSSPINLTQSEWQELKPTQFPVMLTDKTAADSFGNSTPIEMFPGLLKLVSQNSTPSVFSDSRGRDIILGQTRTDNFETKTFPPDPHEFIDQTLISEINPLTSNLDGTTVQTAYGQNVLFHNGRIFFRILPVFTPKE
ncbi:MAG: hypothetical protein LBC20_17100 [Planctomycetaceae bacterium]|jgi:type II secretory pathway pseudopilin PulG|nr:hypothetical protein [Planctomycetaceae bacterium]